MAVACAARSWDFLAANEQCPGEQTMTKKRSGDAWMPAADYGRAMPRFTLNLLVRDMQKSIPFYKDVLGRGCNMRTRISRR